MQGDLAMLMLCPQDMLRAVELMSSADGPLAGWRISVGVHTGPALGGLIEGRQPKFALVGETVTIGQCPKGSALLLCSGERTIPQSALLSAESSV